MIQTFCSFFNIVASHTCTKYRYAALFTLIVLSACNSTTKGNQNTPVKISDSFTIPAPSTISKEESERLRIACDEWYNLVLKTKAFNGGIVVAKKGNIVFESYNGSAHPGGTDTITDSTSFHIASVSKTFTAMAVLKLWQDGKCNIDDEYSKYFPTFNFPGVTIRTMLNHRSGLPNYVHFMENMGWNTKVNINNQDVFDFLVARKAEMKDVGTPNRGFNYCNTNYALLALLIEKLSGEKYGKFLQDSFFTPLKMKHTFVYDNTRDTGKVTLSYDYRGRVNPLNFLDMVYGDKNVYSTPRDLLAWDQALTSGLLLNQKTLDAAYTPYSNEKKGVRNYGLGWRMNIFPSGKKMIYHNGWWHGNNASFIRLIEDSATIIVLGNKYNHGIYHAKDLCSLFGNYYGVGPDDEQETKSTGNVQSTALEQVTTTTSVRKKTAHKSSHVKKKTTKKRAPAKKKSTNKKKK
jgi:CubicO group peptidase (beta-lactamase class C family)